MFKKKKKNKENIRSVKNLNHQFAITSFKYRVFITKINGRQKGILFLKEHRPITGPAFINGCYIFPKRFVHWPSLACLHWISEPSDHSLTCLVEIYYGMHRRLYKCTLEIDLRAKACRPTRPSCPHATDRCVKSRCTASEYTYTHTYARARFSITRTFTFMILITFYFNCIFCFIFFFCIFNILYMFLKYILLYI